MYLPGLRDILDLRPISLADWLVVAATAGSLVLVMELHKRLFAAEPR
jgi:hypothetical protein